MRTTIELPDELLRQARIRAATEGISLKKFFISAVEQKLAPSARPKHRQEPPVIRPGGPQIPSPTPEQIEEAALGSTDDF